jgi:hypothetical protein
LIDTPGCNSTTDALIHAFHLKEALTCQPLNAIFVVIKCENRPA